MGSLARCMSLIMVVTDYDCMFTHTYYFDVDPFSAVAISTLMVWRFYLAPGEFLVITHVIIMKEWQLELKFLSFFLPIT